MDKRIITKYVTDVIDQAPHNREEAIEELVSIIHKALDGKFYEAKTYIVNTLLEIEE